MTRRAHIHIPPATRNTRNDVQKFIYTPPEGGEDPKKVKFRMSAHIKDKNGKLVRTDVFETTLARMDSGIAPTLVDTIYP